MAHQAVLLAGATGLSQVLVAVLYLFAARGVGPGAFGSVVSAVALGTAAAGFIDFGTNNHWTRELARQAIGRDVSATRLFSKIAITIALAVDLDGRAGDRSAGFSSLARWPHRRSARGQPGIPGASPERSTW